MDRGLLAMAGVPKQAAVEAVAGVVAGAAEGGAAAEHGEAHVGCAA